jgi:hypothetical protein
MNMNYRTLLWHFTYDTASRDTPITMQIFSGEEELFARSRYSQPQLPVQAKLLLDRTGRASMKRSDWGKTQMDPSLLRDLGKQLWDAIPEIGRQPIMNATPQEPCWLKISSNSPMIDDLFWEWLGDDQGPFSERPQIRLSRCIPVRSAVPPLLVSQPLRVLLVLTNPKDERLLNASAEIEAVRHTLDFPSYEVQILEEPTWEAMVSALQSQPHIVHYIGHAGVNRGEGNLILHDNNDVSHWIAGTDLAAALPLTTRLLCLSTCFTQPNYQILGLPRLARNTSGYRLPTMIANQYQISGGSVAMFWEEFYSKLADIKGSVIEAFDTAQKTLALYGSTPGDWGGFSLVVRDQTGIPFQLNDIPLHFGLESLGAPNDDNVKGIVEPNVEYIQDITAQITSHLVNDLSDFFLSSGSNVPDDIQSQIDSEAEKVSQLIKKINERKSR